MNLNTRISLVVVALLVTVAAPALGQAINEDLKIVASDGGPDDKFGHSVAIDQGVIAVGASNDDDNDVNSGSAYLFNASTGVQIAKLLPSDGAAGDQFGFSIAISGGIVAVGAPRDEHNGVTSGSAYLFSASTGAQLAKLTPNDGAAGDEFGFSIAIDNGIVAVGAVRDDEYGDDSGAAYLFDASTGDQLDKLLPDTGNNYQTFGVSIAMDDGIVVIGARTFFVLGEGYTFAKAYLFDVSTGNQINMLQADIENYNGDQGGHFGDAVDIDNGIVAVGAWARSIFFDHSGAAYLFDAATGSQLAFIFPTDGQDRDHFGMSISIDAGILVIGADEDDDSAWSGGSAYLFDALTGTQIDKLLASDGAEFDLFGSSIAIDNGVVAVGATGFSTSSYAGAVYVYGAGGPPNDNGICDAGEDCNSCPDDCRAKTKGRSSSRYCCDGDQPDCGDARCNQDGWLCGDSGCMVSADCDDLDSCNGTETCVGGACQPGSPPLCQNGDGCCPSGCNAGNDSDCSSCSGNKAACNVNEDCCSLNCKNGSCKGN